MFENSVRFYHAHLGDGNNSRENSLCRVCYLYGYYASL